VCCIEKPCTVTDSKGARDGNCREKRRCQEDSLASFGLDEGAAGCEMFDVGTGCCAAPAEGANPGGGDPAPIDPSSQGLTETVCSVPFNGVQRAGTCVTPDNCMGGDWAPRTAPGFMGCRNAPQFNDRGCCTAKRTDTGPLPTVCKIGDAATCPFGEVCVDVNSAPTCIVDRDSDCKAAGTCIIGGQECAPDGPNGAHVCGAARTCRVIPCQRADAKCVPDASGLAQCVLANDCFRNPCSFDQVCRPDPRGTRFPSVCAPKGGLSLTVKRNDTGASFTSTASEDASSSTTTVTVLITVGCVAAIAIALVIVGCLLFKLRASRNAESSRFREADMHMHTAREESARPPHGDAASSDVVPSSRYLNHASDFRVADNSPRYVGRPAAGDVEPHSASARVQTATASARYDIVPHTDAGHYMAHASDFKPNSSQHYSGITNAGHYMAHASDFKPNSSQQYSLATEQI
jgi:hypothetical protein